MRRVRGLATQWKMGWKFTLSPPDSASIQNPADFAGKVVGHFEKAMRQAYAV